MDTTATTPSQALTIPTGPRSYQGSCHCGAVRFEATTDLGAGGSRCNCSVCTKVSQMGGIVKPEAFKLWTGEEALSVYEWGGRTGRRYFCKTCGVTVFGRGDLPQLGGAYVSINYNCLDSVEIGDIKVAHFDGRHNNWMAGTRDRPWPILA